MSNWPLWLLWRSCLQHYNSYNSCIVLQCNLWCTYINYNAMPQLLHRVMMQFVVHIVLHHNNCCITNLNATPQLLHHVEMQFVVHISLVLHHNNCYIILALQRHNCIVVWWIVALLTLRLTLCYNTTIECTKLSHTKWSRLQWKMQNVQTKTVWPSWH